MKRLTSFAVGVLFGYWGAPIAIHFAYIGLIILAFILGMRIK